MHQLEQNPRAMIITPHILVAEGLKKLLEVTYPGIRVDTHTHSGPSTMDYTDTSLRLLIVDAAQAFYVPRIILSLRRKLPACAIVALEMGHTGVHHHIQFDDTINTLMTPDQVINAMRDLLTVHDKSPSAPQLTKREMDVLKRFVMGMTAREIAEHLFISVHTVATHRKKLSQKLGIKSVSGMAIYAVSLGLLQPEEVDSHKRD
ncbi:MAG: hypothetical protein CSA97_04340 [Bacteroidetes bacterium]|nr:MAG: hypothetical protein CSA97_04340 [Bacteroidota bacterium]